MKWNIEPIIEGYEWLVDFRVEGEDLVYVVSINYEDIDWENNKAQYIHIENIDYIYYISGGEESAIGRCYDLFSLIEKEVIETIK